MSRIRLSGILVFLLLAACGPGPQNAQGSAAGSSPVTLRLGYLANLTHATALLGLNKGFFQDALGPNVTVTTEAFNAGPQEVEALFGDALDAGFFGPSPAINAYVKSHGDLLRIVSGATSGGAALVVKPTISRAADLRGKTISDPQLGNTQDVSLRAYLASNGYKTDPQGGGDVKVTPTDNATSLQLFQQGKIDGAWVPEPWAQRLVVEAGGKVLVDEATLWPKGQFATTELVVGKKFLDAHPATVESLLRGTVRTADWISQNDSEARALTNQALAKLTQKKLSDKVLDTAWAHLHFTNDPLAESLKRSMANAKTAGLVAKNADINGIFDLRLLNKVLKSANKATVSAAGLGQA